MPYCVKRTLLYCDTNTTIVSNGHCHSVTRTLVSSKSHFFPHFNTGIICCHAYYQKIMCKEWLLNYKPGLCTCMYMCVYICICAYIYSMCIYVRVNIYIYIYRNNNYTCMYVHIYILYIYVHVCYARIYTHIFLFFDHLFIYICPKKKKDGRNGY